MVGEPDARQLVGPVRAPTLLHRPNLNQVTEKPRQKFTAITVHVHINIGNTRLAISFVCTYRENEIDTMSNHSSSLQT